MSSSTERSAPPAVLEADVAATQDVPETSKSVDPLDATLPSGLVGIDVTRVALPAHEAAVRLPALGLGRVVALRERTVELEVSGRVVAADIDPTVHLAVLHTAFERGEPVLVEQRGASLVVVGALRTQPTPGVDKMETIALEADRIELKAKHEIAISSGVAAIALRAVGEVETYADRILSRAETVHKIIGRMLRLN